MWNMNPQFSHLPFLLSCFIWKYQWYVNLCLHELKCIKMVKFCEPAAERSQTTALCWQVSGSAPVAGFIFVSNWLSCRLLSINYDAHVCVCERIMARWCYAASGLSLRGDLHSDWGRQTVMWWMYFPSKNDKPVFVCCSRYSYTHWLLWFMCLPLSFSLNFPSPPPPPPNLCTCTDTYYLSCTHFPRLQAHWNLFSWYVLADELNAPARGCKVFYVEPFSVSSPLQFVLNQ